MTIKKKIIVTGGISILFFACLFLVNLKTYQKYRENIQVQENVSNRLAQIEAFAEWKNTFVSLITNIAASGRVPDDIQKQFTPPSDLLKKESEVLIRAGNALTDQIKARENKDLEIKKQFSDKRLQINELYNQLDTELTTVLAEAEIAKLLDTDTKHETSDAVYLLKTLNQMTLVALNALVSKNLTETGKGALEKSKTFILSQMKSFVENEQVPILFGKLFSHTDSLEVLIVRSGQELSDMGKSVSAAQNEFEKIVKSTDPGQIISNVKSEAGKASQELEKAGQFNLIAMSVFLMGGLLAVVGVIWFIFARVLSPIQRVSIGLNKTANQLAYAAQQVSGSSHSVAKGAATQASSSEEISSSLESVASMTRQNSDKANQMDRFMSDLRQTVETTNTAIDQLSESIKEIASTTDATSGIIKSIGEVAFQTNLLSLNAAVEAARAGEDGAGFAVVAEEVRSLAAKTSELAKNTSDLLARVIRKIGEGSEMLADTNEKFLEIVSSSVSVATLVREIATFSGEQTEGIEQVSRGVLAIDRVVQDNAGSAQEYASIAGELSSQAERMKAFMGELMRIIGNTE